MGKGRDKRKRKAKKKEIQTRGVARAIPEPSGDPPVSGEPDAPVLTPLKPKPHLRSGAVAIPEPEPESEIAAIAPGPAASSK
jgi:hypothetical protein